MKTIFLQGYSIKIKSFLLILGILFSENLFAQTGIGTSTPDASAKLEVSSSNKGFLPPRVALTATNSASPISSPANGLMVFNTVTAGTSPNQVVPGYYYWDSVGSQWVSLSTTVGNVQNQGLFRSTSITTAGSAVSTWGSRFNNLASGDLTITSNTTFALSNGIYKLEWALPHQQTITYNIMTLQEYASGTWSTFRGDPGYASIANGGNTDWGGTTYAADIVDCTSGTRTFRLTNTDGSRYLFNGATFIITKLNPAITTSTTADNLGNHSATKNIQLNDFYLSNDGGSEGVKIDNSGNVGIGTAPSQKLDVNGNVNVTGKINLTDPSGNVTTKSAGFVSAGSFITLDNLKATVTTSGARGLSLATVSGTLALWVQGQYTNGSGSFGADRTGGTVSYSTTPSSSLFGWSFGSAGDTVVCQLTDVTNLRFYRVIMIIQPGYINNFISIERLL